MYKNLNFLQKKWLSIMKNQRLGIHNDNHPKYLGYICVKTYQEFVKTMNEFLLLLLSSCRLSLFCFPVLLFIIPSLTILISTDWKTSNFSSSHISEVSNCMCSRAYHRARHISVFLQMLRSYLRQLARHHILSHTVVLLCTNIKQQVFYFS